jgi:selenocysteine-specific elongation factor
MNSEKPYYILGTAGHIDHGKTALIRALTGIETDRLKEEKERGITIDLGFAYFEGPDGRRYGIVDVPGHERFIPNMLAGAHGFDVVIMVVAADDGVKPQTIEHFDILHLLKVPRAMFVITKIDMVAPERIDEVREEIEILISDSHLADSKIIPASSVTRQGLDDVSKEISRLVSEKFERIDRPFFRYPIDRAFTITGFGTVVTGTIIGGKVEVDDEVILMPVGRELRVRNIEVHELKSSVAHNGQRAAINITKIEKDEIHRGMELASPKLAVQMHNRFYAEFETLPHQNCRLKNFSRVRLFKGSMESKALLVNLEGEHFKPKEHYAVIVSLSSEYLMTSGERFIIRDETNRFTIGGGELILPSTLKRSKLTPDLIGKLKHFTSDDFLTQIEAALIFDNRVFVPIDYLSTMLNRSVDEITSTVKAKPSEMVISSGKEKSLSLKSRIQQKEDAILKYIGDFHLKNPQMPGVEKKFFKETLKVNFVDENEMDSILSQTVSSGKVLDTGDILKLHAFKIEYKGEDSEIKDKILKAFSDITGNTPKPERLAELFKMDEKKIQIIFQGMHKSGDLVGIGSGLYLSRETFEKMVSKAVDFITKNGAITAAQFRDLIGTNRNMAILVLEAMDSKGITVRKENSRILKKKL